MEYCGAVDTKSGILNCTWLRKGLNTGTGPPVVERMSQMKGPQERVPQELANGVSKEGGHAQQSSHLTENKWSSLVAVRE